MKGGDIDNVSSPQVICTTDVVIALLEEETGALFLKKKSIKLGDINMLAANKLWRVSTKFGISLELAAFEDQGWTEELLDKAFERLERRVVNPFNYHQLYSSVEELLGTLPYRPNLKAVIDLPDRVARYGSAGVEIDRI
jgi:hypothetical protein